MKKQNEKYSHVSHEYIHSYIFTYIHMYVHTTRLPYTIRKHRPVKNNTPEGLYTKLIQATNISDINALVSGQ